MKVRDLFYRLQWLDQDADIHILDADTGHALKILYVGPVEKHGTLVWADESLPPDTLVIAGDYANEA